MGFKTITTMDIYEIIRRWHNKQSIHQISKVLGYDRKTVSKLINRVKTKGLTLDNPLPPKDQVIALIEDALPKSQRLSGTQQILEPFLPELLDLVNNKKTPLKPKTAYEVISAKHNLSGQVSYSSFKRFVRANSSLILPAKSGSTCRIEVPPGSENRPMERG